MKNNTPLNILIVDDEPLICIFIKRIVKESGDKVVGICYDSESAIHAIKTMKPDLIFMDINIKGPLDGISVMKKVAEHNAILYYISAYTSDEIINDALTTNPYNYLFKPIKEEKIRLALKLCRNQKYTQLPKSKTNHIQLNTMLCYDAESEQLLFNDTVLKLTKTEQKLVRLFVNNLNTVLSAEAILDTLWKEKNVAPSTLRDHIYRLRQKVPQLNIQNYFAQGYVLHVNRE